MRPVELSPLFFGLVSVLLLQLLSMTVHCSTSFRLCRVGDLEVMQQDELLLVVVNASKGINTIFNTSLDEFILVAHVEWNVQAVDGNVHIQKNVTPLTTSNETELASVSQTADSCNITFDLGSGFSAVMIIREASESGVALFEVSLLPSAVSSSSLALVVSQNIDSCAVFGGGEQYNTVDLRGRVSVVFTREQGVGRGLQPITEILNLFDYVGGSEETNYASRPVLATRNGWLLIQVNPSYSEMDLRINGKLIYFINDTTISGWIGRSSDGSAATAVSTISSLVGRPPPLPAWSYSGAIIGMQGGTGAVLGNWTKLVDLGCPITAFWLQDWTGVRQLDARQGLWWNWRWNATHYPNYSSMIQTLAAHNIRTMAYINPMLVRDPADDAMYREALSQGYFIHCGESNEPWVGYNGASMIDFTSPNASSWYQRIIEDMIMTGVSGWMADFGESVPLDANLFSDTHQAKRYHNAYPDDWFAVNRRAAEAVNRSDDVFFFGRSAWLRSASSYSAGWSGDQLCNFDDFDGIGSAVTSLVTSGLSGTLFQHSDIGGYNAILWYKRSEELFLRWCELSAFSAIFRTHDGSDPQKNWQFYRTDSTMRQFSRYASLFNAWLFYRSSLVGDAIRLGLPIARPLFLHYPDEDEAYNLTKQFLVGSELLVAPVTTEGAVSVSVFVPRGTCWTHIWSNSSVETNATSPVVLAQAAPVGCPAVFVRCQSPIRATLLANLAAADLLTACAQKR